ncbi:DNA glycosylase [Pyrenochaeta sp. MPI-SDFR-AT-0127]|nr:DNA glycosylase [Pyrenochaeta sp. MPI-SDFR-AT-0127]
MAPRKKLPAAMKPMTSTASKAAAIRKGSASKGFPAPTTTTTAAILPTRAHSQSYHYPLLLSHRTTCNALLQWFEGVEETRSMPWRKNWIDPKDFKGREEELGSELATRAYEVWVSEVMLQQTRVSTVIPYFNNWIAKWPTVQDLADANHDDVLFVWKGLGYYSRATRLHEGAKAMTTKSIGSSCPIPSNVEDLQQFPGIGRYTAGAISSIAFGEAAPVLDGNVARVLSRQLGLYMDVKDKKASDILWDVADQLIKHVSESLETGTSSIPGQWNQALMELGSTVCTPRPRCEDCPIQKTCRVYSEGQALSDKRQAPTVLPDIEDGCSLCGLVDMEDFMTASDEGGTEEAPRAAKKRKTSTKQANTISQYFAVGTPKPKAEPHHDKEVANGLSVEETRKRKTLESTAKSRSISAYCSLFPKKVAKKKAAEEDCVVCIVELRLSDGSSKWLIEQRPAKGLLASLWQFPQSTLSASQATPSHRKTSAQQYIASIDIGGIDMSKAEYVAALPPLVHVFTHLKLTMHAYQFRITANEAEGFALICNGTPARKWVDTESMGDETLSTGMHKCWELVSKDV